jgi:hypothetical protein
VKEIPNLSKGSNFQPRISETRQTEEYTFDGNAPTTGVHTADGKLYCGTYSPDRWFSDDIKPFRDQIIELRNKYGNGSNRKKSGNRNRGNDQAKDARRQLQELKKQNKETTRNLSALKSDGGDNKRSDAKDNDVKDQNAGDAFGGKNSMKK